MKDDKFTYSMDQIRIIDNQGRTVEDLENYINELKKPICSEILELGDIVILKYEKCSILVEEKNVVIGNEKYDYLGRVADVSFYEPVYFNQYEIEKIVKRNNAESNQTISKRF